MDDIPVAAAGWHEHGVDVCFAKEGRGGVDGGWKADIGGLMKLALVASADIPLNIVLEGRPPEAVEEGAPRGIEALVPKVIVGVTDEGEALRGRDV